MVLNEADSGAACCRGARAWETQLLPRLHGPGTRPPERNEQPLGLGHQPRSCLQESGLGLYLLCLGM